MSDIERQISQTILTKALKKYQDNPLVNLSCTVGLINQDDIYNWKCTMIGPNDSPYKGGFFQIFIKFPENFPTGRPEVIFNTPIFHLNVNPVKQEEEALGHCCISTINFWTPDTSIEDIFVSVFALFYAANVDSAYLGYGRDVINEFIKDKKSYDERVKYFTKKYANKNYKNEQTQRWDFTYNKDN